MKPKTLCFEYDGLDEFNREQWKCPIAVLHMDNNPNYDPAHYEVTDSVLHDGKFKAIFWAMNRGVVLCDGVGRNKAAVICQDHFDRMIIENCEG